jgi:hypothetical protein
MTSDQIMDELELRFCELTDWTSFLSDRHRALLEDQTKRVELSRLSLIEGYWRIRQTTPLILEAISATNALGDVEAARFWSEHLVEELGHDRMMYADLCAHFDGAAQVEEALARYPISPPSMALVGYFHWAVRNGRPDFLAVLRLFLEMYIPRIASLVSTQGARLGTPLTTLQHHTGADGDHASTCRDYIDARFGTHDLPVLLWTIRFVTRCLIDAQLWATRLLLASDGE